MTTVEIRDIDAQLNLLEHDLKDLREAQSTAEERWNNMRSNALLIELSKSDEGATIRTERKLSITSKKKHLIQALKDARKFDEQIKQVEQLISETKAQLQVATEEEQTETPAQEIALVEEQAATSEEATEEEKVADLPTEEAATTEAPAQEKQAPTSEEATEEEHTAILPTEEVATSEEAAPELPTEESEPAQEKQEEATAEPEMPTEESEPQVEIREISIAAMMHPPLALPAPKVKTSTPAPSPAAIATWTGPCKHQYGRLPKGMQIVQTSATRYYLEGEVAGSWHRYGQPGERWWAPNLQVAFEWAKEKEGTPPPTMPQSHTPVKIAPAPKASKNKEMEKMMEELQILQEINELNFYIPSGKKLPQLQLIGPKEKVSIFIVVSAYRDGNKTTLNGYSKGSTVEDCFSYDPSENELEMLFEQLQLDKKRVHQSN